MASKQITALNSAERTGAPPPRLLLPHAPPPQDLLLPHRETQPQEANFYPRGYSNSRRLSASLISAKTQRIINYNFSQMVSHVPLQVGLCPQKEKDFSAVERGLCVWIHTALHAESAHVAPRPSGKRESATENEPILKQTRRVIETELAAFEKKTA